MSRNVKVNIREEDITTITKWVQTYTNNRNAQTAISFIADALRKSNLELIDEDAAHGYTRI